MINRKALLLATALVIPISAMAQETWTAPQASSSTEETAKSDTLAVGEIIVTAQRREESLQKVPLSVTAVSGAALTERHFSDPAQLQFVAPNLQFTSFTLSPGATNFSVRGIGTSSFSQLIEPSVATVIDGVVLGRPEMGVMQFGDLDRVEVLAGPQGTLFGKNASAGLINIVTTRPKLDRAEVIGHAETGFVNAAKKCCSTVLQGTVNLPVGETAALRINGYFTDYNQLVKDVTPNAGSDYGHQEYGFRPKFLWEPNDRLTIYLAGDYAHGTGIGTGAVTQRTVVPGSPLLPLETAVGIVAGPKNTERSSNAANNVIFNVGGVQSEVSYTFDDGPTISNILAYRKYKARHSFDVDYHQFSYFDIAQAGFNFDQTTEELRISGPSGTKLDYQAGLFLYYGQTNRTDYGNGNLALGEPPVGLVNWVGTNAEERLRSRSTAIYGQATYHITDKARLTAGGRYTWDRLRDFGHSDHDGFLFGFSVDKEETVSTKAKDFSWRVSGQYDFAPSIMGYVTVATGYKGPGFNQIYSGHLAVGPEHSEAYEVGLKSRFGQNFLFNISAYWETVKDLQVQTFRPDIIAYLVSNAGSLRSRGIEVETQWRATTDLSFSGNLSFNDSEFTSFPRAQCYPGQTVAQGCVPDPASPANFITNASGNRLQNAPRWSGTVSVDYTPYVTDLLKAYAHADLYARSGVNFSANGNPASTQKSYTLLNGSVGIGPEDGMWRASIFCRNCLDQRFVTYIEANSGGIVGDYGQTFGLTSFRTIGASIDFRF